MPGSPPPRRQIHGYVSSEARDGWYRFAEAHDTNATALLDAIGQVLGQHVERGDERLPPVLRDAVSAAQRIAGQRSSRRREG